MNRKFFFWSVLITLFMLSNLMATKYDQDISGQAKTAFRSAKMYLGQGIYDKALDQYNIVLEDYPFHVETLETLAIFYYNEKFDDNTINRYHDYFTAHDYTLKALEAIDYFYAKYDSINVVDKKDAKKYLKKNIKKYDLDERKENLTKVKASCWVNIFKNGQDQFNNQDYQNAHDTFIALQEIAPDSVQTLKMLAYTYNNLEESDKSFEIMKEVAEKDPNDELVRQKIANTYFEKEQYEEAAKWFNEAAEINPNNPDNYFNLAITHDKLENTECAYESIKKVTQLDSLNIEAFLTASNFAAELDKIDESLEFLKQAIELDPNNVDYISFLSYKLFQEEEYEELLVYAKKWYELDNTSKEAAQLIYQGSKKTGNKELEKEFENILKNMN